MKRRDFVSAAAGTAALSRLPGTARASGVGERPEKRFRLNHAAHPGMFAHHAGSGYMDQMRYAAWAGFPAWEDRALHGQSRERQMRVAELAIELELTLGALLAYASYNQPTFARPSKRGTESLETRLAQALGCAQLVGVRWIAVIPGARTGELSRAEQISNAAGLLKECAREAQRGNVTILVETTDHPDCLVRSNEEALELAAAVDSPFCSALLRSDRGQDLASILTGDRAPDYLQLGSIPKRSDRELFARLYRSGYEGVIGIAHEAFYPGKRGEEELLHSYRTANQF